MPPSVNMISPPVRFSALDQMNTLAIAMPITRTTST